MKALTPVDSVISRASRRGARLGDVLDQDVGRACPEAEELELAVKMSTSL
jgi:hypothetical protein